MKQRRMTFSAWLAGGAAVLVLMVASSARAAAPSPKDVLDALQKKAETTKSYSYAWDYDGRDEKTGKLKPTEQYTLDFLAPHYRKMTIVKKDIMSNGAVVIYNPEEDKQVVAKKFPLTRKFDTDSKEIDGYFATDLQSIAGKVAKFAEGSTDPDAKEVKFDGHDTWLLTFKPKKGSEYTEVKLWLDAKDHMPRQLEFLDGKGVEDRRHFTGYSFPKHQPSDFKH